MALNIEVERACSVGATLGEGPVWIGDALWFVDIKQHKVHRFVPETGGLDSWTAPAQVGWVQPLASGGMLAGLQSGLHRFDPATGAFDLLVAVEPHASGNRLNDSCVDPNGRLWFGSMDDGERALTGRIYRADARGIAPVVDGIAITNGPAVAPDGRTLFHCDTLRGTIHACDIGDDGALTGSRVFVQVDPAVDGYPDGPIVDADGHVWVGFFSGWCVRRYAPDGSLVAKVRLPVANVTKIAIGGANGRTGYATTAAKGLSDEDRAKQPMAGDVFSFDAGVAGQPAFEVQALGLTLL
ncbi:SMP-30/gluconolactonase/LRE family protein [Sphingomonas sp. Tas61C01]|uniref:SMP-30/gluconolactonase/LRE family protein n=1 Tax=Sphingomonas sp. Tas61C01 TaxID=3458297 RepID=UPI00403EA9EE